MNCFSGFEWWEVLYLDLEEFLKLQSTHQFQCKCLKKRIWISQMKNNNQNCLKSSLEDPICLLTKKIVKGKWLSIYSVTTSGEISTVYFRARHLIFWKTSQVFITVYLCEKGPGFIEQANSPETSQKVKHHQLNCWPQHISPNLLLWGKVK